MAGNDTFSILVNSCDSFEDCWDPFFLLMQRYWPECDAKIFLNTEKKKWGCHGLDIMCTQVQGTDAGRLSWSECLLRALDQIETPLVLYFQEDYFIHQAVRHEIIQRAADYMVKHTLVGHIALTRHCSLGPYEQHEEKWLQTIKQKARYRISTQAGLWRVDTLRSYLDTKENGWMFEIFGTWRSHKRQDSFLSCKWDEVLGGPAIDYLHTGIIKGKWLQAIKPVFEQHGIEVEYEKRGFYRPQPPLLHKLEVVKKLTEHPAHLMRQLL
jgi:hypothetical protein